ncbi:hypothetical protein [Chromatium okenii]|jgi:hypothetical protein|nr:hypothetical protein [Chromatium okenii]MBV5308727.1 hypothetical protein [Chromatium okenii]
MNNNAMEFLDVPVLFGRFLILNGILMERDIVEAVRVQKDLNASPLFRVVEKGLLSLEDVKRARAYQWEKMTTFCQAIDALKILPFDDCNALLKSANQQHIPLGEILVKQGKITLQELANALEQHRKHQSRQRTEIVGCNH